VQRQLDALPKPCVPVDVPGWRLVIAVLAVHAPYRAGIPASGGSAADTGPGGQDGEDCAQKPGQSLCTALGWDFGGPAGRDTQSSAGKTRTHPL
jgi:hypothetical protein